MTKELLDLLSLYIEGKIKLELLDNWIAAHIWDADQEDRDIVDQVAVELSYVKDDVSDETMFRIHMGQLISPTVELAALHPDNEVATTTSSSSAGPAISINLWHPESPVEHRGAFQFA